MENLTEINIICLHYKIEPVFLHELNQFGLLKMQLIDQNYFIHHSSIYQLEKIIRLHHELNVNLEGIDIIMNLLEKINALDESLRIARNNTAVLD